MWENFTLFYKGGANGTKMALSVESNRTKEKGKFFTGTDCVNNGSCASARFVPTGERLNIPMHTCEAVLNFGKAGLKLCVTRWVPYLTQSVIVTTLQSSIMSQIV